MTRLLSNIAKPIKRTVFYSVAAQWDNLGDIEIRNTMLEWILASDSAVIVYVGGMPADYLDVFEVTPNVKWERNALRYQTRLWWKLLRRRASIVFAPGPHVFSLRPTSLAKSIVNLINVVGVRASGGAALAAGRSFRGHGTLSRVLEARIVRVFQLFVVRDNVSESAIRRKLRSAPDLALAHPRSPSENNQKIVVVSLRSDRAFDVDGLQRALESLKARGYDPVVVTQVKRDDEPHRLLAEKLGIRAVLWGGRSHKAQMSRVRDSYAQASMVISNRLHALIFGLQFGALAIPVIDPDSDKLTSTLNPWFDLDSTSPSFEFVGESLWTDFDPSERGSTLESSLERARLSLAQVRDEFAFALKHPKSSYVQSDAIAQGGGDRALE